MKTMTEELIIPATILEDGMEIPGTGEFASVPVPSGSLSMEIVLV